MGIDEVGIDKVGIDKVGRYRIQRGLPTRSNPITVIMSNTFWICTGMSNDSIISIIITI